MKLNQFNKFLKTVRLHKIKSQHLNKFKHLSASPFEKGGLRGIFPPLPNPATSFSISGTIYG